MAVFVQGPWAFDQDELSVSADGGVQICTVLGVDDFPCIDPDTHDEEAIQRECVANGRLIAAAPAFFAAVEAVLDYAGMDECLAGVEAGTKHPHDAFGIRFEDLLKLRDALRLAKGEV